MSMTDPIADFLTRIRNGIQAAHEEVVIPAKTPENSDDTAARATAGDKVPVKRPISTIAATRAPNPIRSAIATVRRSSVTRRRPWCSGSVTAEV